RRAVPSIGTGLVRLAPRRPSKAGRRRRLVVATDSGYVKGLSGAKSRPSTRRPKPPNPPAVPYAHMRRIRNSWPRLAPGGTGPFEAGARARDARVVGEHGRLGHGPGRLWPWPRRPGLRVAAEGPGVCRGSPAGVEGSAREGHGRGTEASRE